jgi:dihydroorotate dehydrogenase (fumarate)
MRWIAILYGRVASDLGASGGVHHADDVIKMLLVGARVTMLCSTLLQKGIEHIRVVEQGIREWLEEREYDSVHQMQGSMSQFHSADPSAFERAQYVRALQSFGPG